MKINFLRKIIITILLTTVIISCQFSSDSNQKQNYTPSPSFFWGTWIRMDNGLEYYIDEKKVVTENKEFQIDAKNSDSSTLKIKNMTEFEKQSDSVIINDGIPYFRKGGTDLKYTLKLVGFDNVINSSARAASGTSLGGVKAKGQSGKYPSYTDENVSDDSGEITLISKTVDDENTVTIDTGDGVVVIPGIKIGNDGDFAGTIPLVGKDDYVLKITGEIPEEEKTDGYLYGNNFKSYPMKLSIKNVSEVTSAYSLCKIKSNDPNLILSSSEPIEDGISISTMKPGAEKTIDIEVSYGTLDKGYINTGIDIQITNGKTNLTWVDYIPLRFYKGVVPITIAAKNPENNIDATLNGFIINPDGYSQFFSVNDGNYTTIYTPSFLEDDKYLMSFCGATVTGELSTSTEMFYTVAIGRQLPIEPSITGNNAFEAYRFGEINETENDAFVVDNDFEAYIGDGEIDYFSLQCKTINVIELKNLYSTISYISSHGNSLESVVVTKGITVSSELIPELSDTNYIFDGWYINDVRVVEGITQIERDSVFIARWLPKKYKINYVLDDGVNSDNNPTEYTVETDGAELFPANKYGYRFDGWYIDSACTKKIYKITKGMSDNLTLYAKWSFGIFNITYVLDGGQNNSDNPLQYSILTEKVTLKNPTKPGYSFDGWFMDPEFNLKINEIDTSKSIDITLYAKWIKGTIYDITYNEIDNIRFISGTTIYIRCHGYWDSTYIYELAKKISSSYNTLITIDFFDTSIYEISNYFSGCSQLQSIIFPKELKTIGVHAFENCDNLVELNFPSSLESIGPYAFRGCVKLINVNFSDVLTSIDKYAFEGCIKLNELEFPSSLRIIGDYAFQNCTNILNINFSNCTLLETIGDYAFKKCTNILDINFSDCTLLKTIGYAAFNGCQSITEINLPSSLQTIGEYAFLNCTGIVRIDFSECRLLCEIGVGAFEDCSNIIEIDLSNCLKIQEISDATFSGCLGMDKIEFPSSLEIIGKYAFRHCEELKDIDFSKYTKLKKIGEGAFEYSGFSIVDLTKNSALRKIGSLAFYCTTTSIKLYEAGWYYTSNSDYSNGTYVSSSLVNETYKKNSSKYWYR